MPRAKYTTIHNPSDSSLENRYYMHVYGADFNRFSVLLLWNSMRLTENNLSLDFYNMVQRFNYETGITIWVDYEDTRNYLLLRFQYSAAIWTFSLNHLSLSFFIGPR